jgi:hypothetical protein
MDAAFCVDCLEDLARGMAARVFSSNQGSQFTEDLHGSF